jgi:hypothetical protein
MKDMSRINRIVERFKIDAGLFWINDLEELDKYLGNRVNQHSEPVQHYNE